MATDWDADSARDVLAYGTDVDQFRAALAAAVARIAELERDADEWVRAHRYYELRAQLDAAETRLAHVEG